MRLVPPFLVLRTLAAGVLLTALDCTPSVAQTHPSGEAIARGDSLLGAFRTLEAIAAYRAGLARTPDDAVLLWKTARALATLSAETPEEEGDQLLLTEAVALARRAVESGPGLARAHTTLAASLGMYGRFLAHTHRVRKAREVIAIGHEMHAHAQRAIELDPNDFGPYLILGIYHRELATVHPLVKVVAQTFLGDWPDVSLEKSRSYLTKAADLAPRDVTARLELGRTLLAMGDESGARRELERAIALPARENLDLIEQRKARALLSDIV